MPAKVRLELTASFTSNSTKLTFLKVDLAGSRIDWSDGPARRDPALVATGSSTPKLNAFVRMVVGHKLGVSDNIEHFVGQLRLMRLKPKKSNQALRLLGGTGANGIGRLRDLFEDPEPPSDLSLKICEKMLPASNIGIYIRSCADADLQPARPEELMALHSGIHPIDGKVVPTVLDECIDIAEYERKQDGPISTDLGITDQIGFLDLYQLQIALSQFQGSNLASPASSISVSCDKTRPLSFEDSESVLSLERFGNFESSRSSGQKQVLPSCDAIETPGSLFYVERTPFAVARGQLESKEPTVIIRGHRQSGRTSLLASLEADARSQRVPVVTVSFMDFLRSDFNSGEQFYCKLMEVFLSQLKLDVGLREAMRGHSGAQHRFSSFITKLVEDHYRDQLLVILDDVDALFDFKHLRDDFFSLVRGWSNLNIGIRIVVSHATEPRLWIVDLNRSPFNVGLPLMLEDFSVTEMSYLSLQYTRFAGKESNPLAYEQVTSLHAFTGGHPRLTRESLSLMTKSKVSFEELMERITEAPQTVFSNLETCLKLMQSNPRILQNLRMITKAEDTRSEPINEDDFERLRMAGLVLGTSKSPRLRCKAYQIFFERAFA